MVLPARTPEPDWWVQSRALGRQFESREPVPAVLGLTSDCSQLNITPILQTGDYPDSFRLDSHTVIHTLRVNGVISSSFLSCQINIFIGIASSLLPSLF